jgi:8-oxo-dGTP pyrophosphatase MutT (NUDIX family)
MSQFIKSAILIKKEDRFLLVQENGARVHGLWNWPQGKVEIGETIEQTAIREAKEETGLDIKIEKSLGVLQDTFPDIKELHVYLGSVLSGGINFPVNEIIDVQFFTFEQIEGIKNKLVGEWVYELISQNK